MDETCQGNGPLDVPFAPALGVDDRQALLAQARRALSAVVRSESFARPALVEDAEVPRALARKHAVFVSVYHQSDLRGCIGTLKASRSLWEATSEMAVAAATRDSRFSPLDPRELDDLAIEVSVLGPFANVPHERRDPAASFLEIGEHGAYVEQGNRSALFLPQVATRFRWSAVKFLEQLTRKAELAESAWLAEDSRLELFRVASFRGSPSPGS